MRLDSSLGAGSNVVGVGDGTLTIGRFARASGLSVKALRIYERVGLLPPAIVDPANGYRCYAPEQLRVAQAIQHMRAMDMPLRVIAGVLQAEPADAHRLVDGYLAELRRSVARAQKVATDLHTLINEMEEPMSPRLTTETLADGLRRVLFAAGTDPKRPKLASVLIRGTADATTLVTTDSYRLVECVLPAAGFEGELLVHHDSLAGLAATLREAADVTLALAGVDAVLTAGDREIRLPLEEGPYVNYEALINIDAVVSLDNDTDEMLAVAEAAGDDATIDLSLDATPTLGAARLGGTATGEPMTITLKPEYLADGLRAIPGSRVRIEASHPHKPIGLQAADGDGYRYLLMPIRRA